MKRFNDNLRKLICGLLCLTILCAPFMALVAEADDTDSKTTGSRIIVSLGDSYASGEGIEEFYGQDLDLKDKVRNDDWLAHRSTKSWSGQLKLDGVKGTMKDNRGTNWFFVAASGAETKHLNGSFYKVYCKNGLFESYIDYKYLDPQLNVFSELRNKGLEAEYVTVSLGGNDAKFAEVISDAASSSLTFNPSALAEKLNTVWADFYKDGGIRDNLYNAYKDIEEAAGKQAKIIVVGYPKLLNKDGKGLPFSKDAATMVNDSVYRFNREIETLVNQCKAEGMKICFVSVEEAFDGKEAYSKNAYINKIDLVSNSEDLVDFNPFITDSYFSSYSVHPNAEGAKAYAKCVQAKIDSIEKDGGRSEWPEMSGSELRDVALVLDSSGSMQGQPMAETKEAAKKFINTVFEEDSAVGIVTYDYNAYTIARLCKNEPYLNKVIEGIGTGSSTNIEAGLIKAEEMLRESSAKRKLIVLMSDGMPNEGRVGEDLVAYADQLKEQGLYIYTLGFFSALGDGDRANAQNLMGRIASEGCHFEVENADDLVFFFNDIADQIKGTRYIYVKIACPVDVVVRHDGQVLSSRKESANQRTDFGTLTFEENPKENSSSSDNRIKILRLKEGEAYDIEIKGNGKGTMNYSIGFMDENGEYSDMRVFSNVKITKDTEIETVATTSKTTYMKVDNDGDGEFDLVYRANANDRADLVNDEVEYIIKVVAIVLGSVLVFIILLVIVRKIIRLIVNREKKIKAAPSASVAPVTVTVTKDPDREKMDFCNQCGQKKKASLNFCPYCGAEIKRK